MSRKTSRETQPAPARTGFGMAAMALVSIATGVLGTVTGAIAGYIAGSTNAEELNR